MARTAATTGAIVGLSPEGMDSDRAVGRPPRGSGRFIALLVGAGLPLLPAGVVEGGGTLYVSFGRLFVPAVPSDRASREPAVSAQVMGAISRQVSGARKHIAQ
jgi:hypothetical protein